MHDHHAHMREQGGRRLLLSLAITLIIMVVEIIGGIVSGSLALLSDAGHMAIDACSLLIGYLAIKLGCRPPDRANTFGLRRIETIAAFVNGLLLFGIVCGITLEAAHRVMQPAEIHGRTMTIVAVAGLLGNILSWLLLNKHRDATANFKAAFLHVFWDAISSGMVIVASAIIVFTGWTIVDPLASLLIAMLMLRSAKRVVLDAAHVLLEGAPRHIDLAAVEKDICAVRGVVGVHDVHLTTHAEHEHIFTAHLVLGTLSLTDWFDIAERVRTLLHDRYSIHHATLEPETAGRRGGNHVHCDTGLQER